VHLDDPLEPERRLLPDRLLDLDLLRPFDLLRDLDFEHLDAARFFAFLLGQLADRGLLQLLFSSSSSTICLDLDLGIFTNKI